MDFKLKSVENWSKKLLDDSVHRSTDNKANHGTIVSYDLDIMIIIEWDWIFWRLRIDFG